MATPRLTFLYPILFRPGVALEAHATKPVVRHLSRPDLRSAFGASTRRRAETYTQRYGTANEPMAHLGRGKAIAPQASTNNQEPSMPRDLDKVKSAQPEMKHAESTLSADNQKGTEGDNANQKRNSKGFQATPTSDKDTAERPPLHGTALSAILAVSEDNESPPHLQAPPYVHHFDTHTLVRSLENGGWSEDQAITTMKAVRTILADNIDIARKGIVSKADGEMESYLFRAASAELRTEIQNNRRIENEKTRSERTQLQHEADILNQRLSADAANLRDELKGMLDDRKMASRMERRRIENRIQEVNYKITVALNSDTRSDIEGLRWVLTRRTVFALGSIVAMTLATLRYASYLEKKQEFEQKRLEQLNVAAGRGTGSFDYGAATPQEEVMKRGETVESSTLLSIG